MGQMTLFTHDVTKVKSAAHKNGDIDATCKRALTSAFSFV